MTNKPFQPYELEAYLGDFVDDYDTDAIINDTTYIDESGSRYWLDFDECEFAAIVASHEVSR